MSRCWGTCDLPYLPVKVVEEAIQQEIERLRLMPPEIACLRERVARHMEQRLGAEKETHARAKTELAALDVKDERLLDLAAEGSLSADKMRERIRRYQVQRAGLLPATRGHGGLYLTGNGYASRLFGAARDAGDVLRQRVRARETEAPEGVLHADLDR